MPVIKSAKKKLRQDKKKERQNKAVRRNVRKAILAYKKKPTPGLLTKVFSQLDKAAKKKIMHPNKAGRLKSKLSKLLSDKSKEIKSPRKKVNVV